MSDSGIASDKYPEELLPNLVAHQAVLTQYLAEGVVCLHDNYLIFKARCDVA